MGIGWSLQGCVGGLIELRNVEPVWQDIGVYLVGVIIYDGRWCFQGWMGGRWCHRVDRAGGPKREIDCPSRRLRLIHVLQSRFGSDTTWLTCGIFCILRIKTLYANNGFDVLSRYIRTMRPNIYWVKEWHWDWPWTTSFPSLDITMFKLPLYY